MAPEQLVFLWLIISSLSLCAMIFGIRYMMSKEITAMIEKGMDPKVKIRPRPAPFRNLKWGLLLVGSGLGFFAAYLLDHSVFNNIARQSNFDNDGANIPVYFALTAIGGGLGLILSYRIEKKELLDKNELLDKKED